MAPGPRKKPLPPLSASVNKPKGRRSTASSSSTTAPSLSKKAYEPFPLDLGYRRLKIKDYPGRLREWNAEWERRLTAFYDPASPPFVDEKEDAADLAIYVDEWGYHCREAGIEGVKSTFMQLCLEKTAGEFEGRYAEPWRRAGREKREEMLLKVLEHAHRQSAKGPERWETFRMLVPEITLERMAGGDGEGFLKLIDALLVEGWTEDEQWTVFLRHEAFERKFLFNFDHETLLPASQALRGFQFEQLLIRTSYLLTLVLDLLCVIVRTILSSLPTFTDRLPRAERRQVGGALHRDLLEARILGQEQRGYRREGRLPARAGRGRADRVEVQWLREDRSVGRLVLCRISSPPLPFAAAEIAPKKLLSCSKCRRIGRYVHWCSSYAHPLRSRASADLPPRRQCMDDNFKLGIKHKETCGQTLKNASTLPTFSARKPSVRLNAHLQLQLECHRTFGAEVSAIWFFCRRLSLKGRLYQQPFTLRSLVTDSAAVRKQQMARMIAIRDSAIHQRDDESLGILLGYLLECPDFLWTQEYTPWIRENRQGKRDVTKAEQAVINEVNTADVRRQLMEAFELKDARVNELIEIGWKALKEPGREVERVVWRTVREYR